MPYFTELNKNKLLLLALASITSQFVFANPNMSGQISRQINRTTSQAINQNISDRMVRNVKNKRIYARIHTKGQITEAQQLLHDLGYKLGKIDGLMGRKTRKAIRDFQKNHNLKGDGLLTDDLFQKLSQSNR